MSEQTTTQQATFAAGCFWGVESFFRSLPGVLETTVGYTGGHLADPTYEQVCRGDTGHAEAILIEFEPNRIDYGSLLEKFFEMHDPTQRNRQGPDIGEQYRSAVFYHNELQKKNVLDCVAKLTANNVYKNPIVTQIEPASVFYRAEEYHQNYLVKNGRSCRI